jgi:uncharacterized protein (TIGR04222 family)
MVGRRSGRHPLGRVLLLVAALALAGLIAPSVAVAQEFGEPTPGRRVYDEAGVLTTAEVERLEEAAANVTAAGAPTIVYVRSQEADAEETVQDAADLMEAWAVESNLGAKDGLVLFLNVDPDEAGEYDVGFWAGETHAEGNLPEGELQRIVDDEVLPRLRDEQVAAGLLAGLDTAANSLTYGPPPPPPPSEFERRSGDLARWPLAIVGLVGSALVGWLTYRTARGNPAGRARSGPSTLFVPGELRPALAGALVAGHVSLEQHVATVLDLAGRGALVFEPAPSGKKGEVQVLLVDESLARDPHEQAVWSALTDLADPAGVIDQKALAKLRGRVRPAEEALRAELVARGWWDPALRAQRRPLIVAGIVALAAALVGLVVTIAGEEPWGLVGTLLLAVAGGGALVYGLSYPPTTAAGNAEAAAWRGLRSGLKRAQRDQAATVDLDRVLPYAVALGVSGALDRRLKAASAEGKVPLAFRQGVQGDAWAGGFYPYWASFAAVSTPSSAGGIVGAGGAAAGGAGAGGST